MAANVQFVLDADTAKAVDGMLRVVDSQRRVEGGFNRVRRKGVRSGREVARSFGRNAVRDLKGFALGMVGISAAIGGVSAAIRGMAAERERAARRARQSEMQLGSLAQLASTPKEMRRLTAAARKTYAEGGAESLGQAASTVFSLESAGALGQRKLFSQLHSSALVENPATMARAAKTMIASMGKKETTGFRALVSKAFGASKYSPVSAEALLEAASRSGGSAASMGLRDEEVLAATALTATATGSAERGGTQLASLLRSFDQSGRFKGLNLRESVRRVGSMGLDSAGLQKLLGREEAVNAYRVLNRGMDSGQYAEALGNVDRSEREDLVRTKLRLYRADPKLRASREARLAEANRNLSQEEYGRQGNLADAAQQRISGAYYRRGGFLNQVRGYATDAVASTVRTVAGDEFYTRNLAPYDLAGAVEENPSSSDSQKLLGNVGRVMVQSAQHIQKASENLSKSTVPDAHTE